MIVTHKITIDLARRGVPPRIDAMQGDANTRKVEVTLFENEAAWPVQNGTTVAVAFLKTDGTSGLYDKLPDNSNAAVFSNNVVTITLAPQVLTAYGEVSAAVIFYDANMDAIATFPFLVFVERNPGTGRQISNNYYYFTSFDAINEAINKVNSCKVTATEQDDGVLLKIYNESISGGVSVNTVFIRHGKNGGVQTVNGIAPDKNGNVEVETSGATDKQVQSAVNSWLDEHPEAVTTVQDGAITEEKLSDELKNRIEAAGVSTFATQYIGQLFDPPADYTFWSPQTLVYDPKIKKYVDLLFCTTAHLAADSAHTLWVTYIDPETFEASEPVQCAYMDEGTVLTPPDAGCAAFIILDDGRYMQINRPTSSSTDMYLFYSEDYGKTWVKGELASGFDTTNEVYYIVRLSNGRLLANNTAIPYIYYSDDGGKNWSKVRPTTCGGNMESEINFFEVKAGVVIAIGRYSMSGMGVNESGDCQHAIISYSEDYGTTWTPWKLSETIDNMNASCCSGYLHDGVLELFVGSRWYHYGANATTDYTNTGKSGAITHYTATIENALADNFTKLGAVVYSKAVGDLSSQDFHTPCVAVNGKEMLMVYCDRVPPYTVADKANHYYVRGSLDGLDYGVRDDLKSNVFPMSSAKVNALINRAKNELTVKINEAILSGNLIPPTPDDDGNPGTFVFDGIVCNFNYLDEAKYNAENATLTDSINGVVGTFVAGGTSTNISRLTAPSTIPEIRDNSASVSTLYIPNDTLSQFVGEESTEITIEISQYRYSGDTLIGGTSAQFYTNSMGGSASVIKRNGFTACYTNTSGTNTIKDFKHTWFVPSDTLDVLAHSVAVVGSDGSIKMYMDGVEVVSNSIGEDFARFAAANFTQNQYFRGHMKAVRIYNRALTAEEVATNYAYEKATIV